jgi:hypothetical protein
MEIAEREKRDRNHKSKLKKLSLNIYDKKEKLLEGYITLTQNVGFKNVDIYDEP